MNDNSNNTPNKHAIGIVGLGKMGRGLALQAAEKGYPVVGYDRTPDLNLPRPNLELALSLQELANKLERPRRVFIYIPAGTAIDHVLDDLAAVLEEGDMIVDGGNSYWGDSIRRAARLREKGLYLIDCGTSGGVEGARNGACFMVGGEEAAVNQLTQFFTDMAVPNGYTRTGGPGSGHFVKLVHNGIEFGMLQAIGEGMQLLTHYREPLNLSDILLTWNNGSVIRSWLIELMKRLYDQKEGFNVPSYIEDTGEVNWLVSDALRMEVPIPVIAQSVMQLFASRDEDRTWAKAIAMMRHGFGGHPFGTDAGIQHERKFGRVGDFPVEKAPLLQPEK